MFSSDGRDIIHPRKEVSGLVICDRCLMIECMSKYRIDIVYTLYLKPL